MLIINYNYFIHELMINELISKRLGDKIARTSVQVWKMQWHSSGPVKGGREKLIVNTRTSDYMSVHTITTGKRHYGASPQKQLRVNHFRRHFRGKGKQPQKNFTSAGRRKLR